MRVLKYAIVFLMIFSTSTSIAESVGDVADQEKAFRSDAYIKLTSKRYSDLERQYAAFLESYSTGQISEEELSAKFEVFSNVDDLESRFDEWVKAYPKSYTAIVARGIYRASDAWKRRSIKFADETTNEQLKGFKEGLRKAALDLQASIKLYSRPVVSYRYLIRVSMGLGLGVGRGLLDEALKIDPYAYYPRHQYQYSLTPKWGGGVPLLEEFLQECRKSPMSTKNKERIEALHYTYLGEQALLEKRYRQAADDYAKAYQHVDDPESLFMSGTAAFDGSFYDLALAQFDALIKAHPKYEFGYTKRGYLYESHFKSDKKAFNDYLVAANLGNSWAQNRVGWWYMTGKYVTQDYIVAEAYLRRAAAQNNKNAIVNLSDLDKLRK